MKRTVLTDEQLRQLTGLRQGGLSWVKIQDKTGIPRRIAKREYLAWERRQSNQQLQDARKAVVAQEYRMHLELLSRLAGVILDSLVLPIPLEDERSAEGVIEEILESDIYGGNLTIGTIPFGQHRETLLKRMNRLLFESLRKHTLNSVRWESLEDWKKARSECLIKIETLKNVAGEILENILKQKSEFQKFSGEVGRIEEGITAFIWVNDVLRKKGCAITLEQNNPPGAGGTFVVFHEKAPAESRLEIDQNGNMSVEEATNLAEQIIEVSKWVAKNLRISHSNLINGIKKEIKKMQKATNYLETDLNPLKLRSIIFKSDCDICPM